MAPRLIARSIRFPSQVGSAETRKGIGDRGDLARITETGRASKPIRTFLPLFKGQGCRAPASSIDDSAAGPGDADGGAVRCTAGGRLAQLVRALP